MKKRKLILGMSLLEILVVIGIFAILGVIVARSVLLTVRGTKKSESTLKVRENVDYSLGVIERQLRNANGISECPNDDTSRIDYVDQLGNAASFSCEDIGNEGYIASSSARLTNTEVIVNACSFTCAQESLNNPPQVTITIDASDSSALGIEGANFSTSTTINLRNY